MVSGYDKRPPDDRYEPDLGWSGRAFIILLVVIVLAIGLGPLLP